MTKKGKTVFKHQSNHFVAVFIDAIVDTRLEFFDRCLLSYMQFRFNYFQDVIKKPYFESTQTLADVFNVHRNTVSRAIQTLKELGYISVTTKKGGSNTYTNVTTQVKAVNTPVTQEIVKKVAPKVVEPDPIFDRAWETEDDPF